MFNALPLLSFVLFCPFQSDLFYGLLLCGLTALQQMWESYCPTGGKTVAPNR